MEAPFLYNLLGVTFYLGVRLFLEVRVDGIEHYQHTPSTLVVVNHKRDLDVLIVAPTLYLSRGLRRPGLPLTFVGREDLFLPGFLGAYLEGPRWLRRALSRFDVGPILRRLNAAPIRRFPERTVREILFEVLEVRGDLPIGSCLEDEALIHQRDLDSQTPIRSLVHQVDRPWLHQPASLAILREPLRRQVRNRQPQVVAAQLAHFSRILEEGGVVYLAPEGVLSRDGRLGRIRGSLHYLLERIPGIRVLPVALSYDFLTAGRMGVFVAIGPLRSDLAALPRQQRNREVRRSLAGLTTITLSQIAGWVITRLLEEGIEEIDAVVLEETIKHRAHLLAMEGHRVDRRLLDDEWFRLRWGSLVAFGRRRGFLRTFGSRVHLSKRAILEDVQTYRENPVRYAANELESILQELGVAM